MKAFKITITCLLIASAMFVVSCKKSNDASIPSPTGTDTDVSAASDNTFAENTSSDVVEIGAEVTDEGGMLSNFRLSGSEEVQSLTECATVDTTNKSKGIIVVSFNPLDTCYDGRVRGGSLTYTFSPGMHYRDPGFTFTVSSNNYVVDGNMITVSHTVLNTTPIGFNPKNVDETWSIIANLEIIRAGGDTINWSANHVKTLLNTSDSTIYRGSALPIVWSRARVGITGNENGSRSGGANFTVNVTDQLVRDFGSCRIHGRVPFILGKLIFTLSTKKYPRYVDYGAPNNGACDTKAAVTINGITIIINLP